MSVVLFQYTFLTHIHTIGVIKPKHLALKNTTKEFETQNKYNESWGEN